MLDDILNDHLCLLRQLVENPPNSRNPQRPWSSYLKELAACRSAVKQEVSETLLNGRKIDRDQVDATSESFKSHNRTKYLAHALGTVPGLVLDHSFLVREGQKIVGLVTMPYCHRDGFVETGSNELVSWSTYDDFSWHFPGSTRLTLILDKRFLRSTAR